MKSPRAAKILLFIIIFGIFAVNIAMADVGPKPSVTVYVKNYKTQNYYLDLLTKDGYVKYDDFNDRHYSQDYKNLPLYKYNEDGWIANHIRNFLLFGSLTGQYDAKKGMMVHNFTYHGVPSTFKVIVQYPDGEIVTSNVITPKQFNAEVVFDLATGTVTKVPQISHDPFYYLLLMAITVVIEIIIAWLFKIFAYMVVAWANILTQLILHISLVLSFGWISYTAWIVLYAILEILAVAIEFLIYRKYLKHINDIYWEKVLRYSNEENQSKKITLRRILIYTITANIVTFLLGLVI